MSSETDEWEWEALAVAALDVYQNGQAAQARHLWTRAWETSSSFEPDDPRRAASANNRALGCLIAGEHEKAAAGFAEAAALWDKAVSWTERMTVGPIARSSLFHLRMAERHKAAFTTVRRSRLRELLEGAQALTQFNQAIALLFLDDDTQADRLLAQAAARREASCGPNSPELAQMIEVIAGRLEHGGDRAQAQALDLKIQKIAQEGARGSLQVWKDEQINEQDDPRRLLAGVQLTAMVQQRDFM